MNDDETDDLGLAIAILDAVLPAGVPVLPLLDLGARFNFPDGAREPVGNWLDVIALTDGRLAIVVGEAPGTGIAAGVAMGQISAVVRAGLQQEYDVVAALAVANTYAAASDGARGTAMTVAVIDPIASTLSYATAGHPAPLVVSARGSAELLTSTGGGPLGAGTAFVAAIRALDPGDTVLLTCAAALHRGRALDLVVAPDESTDPLADLDRTASALFESMAGEETLTLVAARVRSDAHGAMQAHLVSDAAATGQARELVGAWLTSLTASPMDQMALGHAVGELVTNSVEHGACGGRDGRSGEVRIELRAALGSDGVARVEVHDDGSWRTPADTVGRGRGLAMAAGLVDRLDLFTDAAGTHAVLHHRLLRPVSIQTGTPGSTGPPTPVEIVRTPEAISLHGTFNPDDVERVAATVLIATQAGTRPLTLDLTEVTRLSTDSIRLLADLTSANGAPDMTRAGIRILTTAGSVIGRSLDSARVPHDGA